MNEQRWRAKLASEVGPDDDKVPVRRGVATFQRCTWRSGGGCPEISKGTWFLPDARGPVHLCKEHINQMMKSFESALGVYQEELVKIARQAGAPV